VELAAQLGEAWRGRPRGALIHRKVRTNLPDQDDGGVKQKQSKPRSTRARLDLAYTKDDKSSESRVWGKEKGRSTSVQCGYSSSFKYGLRQQSELSPTPTPTPFAGCAGGRALPAMRSDMSLPEASCKQTSGYIFCPGREQGGEAGQDGREWVRRVVWYRSIMYSNQHAP